MGLLRKKVPVVKEEQEYSEEEVLEVPVNNDVEEEAEETKQEVKEEVKEEPIEKEPKEQEVRVVQRLVYMSEAELLRTLLVEVQNLRTDFNEFITRIK